MSSRTCIAYLVMGQLCCHVRLCESCFSIDTELESLGERRKGWGGVVHTTEVHPCLVLLSFWEPGRLYFSTLLQLNRPIWLVLAKITWAEVTLVLGGWVSARPRHDPPGFHFLAMVTRESSSYFRWYRFKMEEHQSTWRSLSNCGAEPLRDPWWTCSMDKNKPVLC